VTKKKDVKKAVRKAQKAQQKAEKARRKSARELDELAARLETAEARLRKAEARLRDAETRREEATAHLEKATARAERWKADAKRSDADARESAKQLKKLRKQLEAALATPTPAGALPVVEVGEVAEVTGIAIAPATELATLEAAVQDAALPGAGAREDARTGGGTPDVTWTVTALRVAAREKGIPGYSRRPKAELVRLLTE
jgi:colicin import membrane protein